MFDFDTETVAAIEQRLDAALPGEWRRAVVGEAQPLARIGCCAAWRLDMPLLTHGHPLVDHVWIGIDRALPWSEPRVWAPQSTARGAPEWPHIEHDALLCLSRTSFAATPAERVLGSYQDAAALFQYSAEQRVEEFRREYRSYWLHAERASPPLSVSLMGLDPHDREVVCWQRAGGGWVVADDEAMLRTWAKQSGESFTAVEMRRTRLMWLSEPPSPDEYPRNGRDIFNRFGVESLIGHLRFGSSLPVFFGVPDAYGAQFLGVALRSAKKNAAKGFRKTTMMPTASLPTYFSGEASRFRVERVDRHWVLGRDQNPNIAALSQKKVAVVGCGALGGYLARTLVQSGVGHLILMDEEQFVAANASRHLLGLGSLGDGKADALARQLGRDFPGIATTTAFGQSVERSGDDAVTALKGADLVVSAGVSLVGDMWLDTALSNQGQRLAPWLCCWTEEHALAAHAIVLTGNARLRPGFDEQGQFVGRLTASWPANVATLPEAGCGNTFQPYGATELQHAVLLASRLAIDVLLGEVAVPTWAMWLGDRSRAVALGAHVDARFDQSFAERRGPWPHD